MEFSAAARIQLDVAVWGTVGEYERLTVRRRVQLENEEHNG